MAGSRMIPLEAVITEVSSVEAAAAETATEIAPSEVINTEVTTSITLVPLDKNRNSSCSNHFSYTVSDLNDFAETSALAAPVTRPSQEKAAIPLVLDLVGLDVLYHSMI